VDEARPHGSVWFFVLGFIRLAEFDRGHPTPRGGQSRLAIAMEARPRGPPVPGACLASDTLTLRQI